MGNEDGQSRDGKRKENSVERLPQGCCQEVCAEVEGDRWGHGRSRPPAWDDEKPRTTHRSEQHMQLGLRLQTRCDPFQKLPPPVPTCSDSTGAQGGCGHPVFVDGEGKPCQEMHWYTCSPILKNFLRNHSLGRKKKTLHET